MASSSAMPSAPIFVGENYDFLCIKMKAMLTPLDLWEMIEQGFKLPESTVEQKISSDEQKLVKEKTTKNARAIAYLHSAIGEAIFPRIVNTTSAKEIWDILKVEFQGSHKVRAIKFQNLRRDFENLKMKPSESMKDNTSRIIDTVNQMKIYGDNISDKRIVNKTLCSLDNKFNFIIVTAIEESKDVDTLVPQELFGSLQAHESKVSGRNEGSSEGAFQAKHKQKSQNFKNNKKKANVQK
ncbi:uncharacterized protein LOC141641668 [Silene latifolia]|uniref:uncharacterized protein LOC141641668 n=1 Tax=Silene latifolia TaxID=37657 RepID=UPI003D785FC4